MLSQAAFFDGYILRWEDGGSIDPNSTHSMRRNDGGNWTGGKVGAGVLVGSNHGVTPVVLANHRGVPASSISWTVMHALTRREADEIAITDFYSTQGLDRLPWDPVVASAVDMGWGAGPFHGKQLLQRAIGDILADGAIGTGTIAAYTAWIARIGLEAAARAYAAQRYAYYEKTIAAHPEDAEFRPGWRARTDSFLPGTPWWASWGDLSTAAAPIAADDQVPTPSMADRIIARVKRVL